MSQPLVSAIILNYRTGRDAWRCIEALEQQALPSPSRPAHHSSLLDSNFDRLGSEGGNGSGVGGEGLEVLVVDNHSDDDSIGYLRNRVRGHLHVRILETPQNSGFGAGYNLGFRHARGKYLLLNNPAKILEQHALKKMVDAMEQDPTIGILGPKLIHKDGTIRDSYRSFPRILDVVIKRSPLRHVFKKRMRRYLQWDRDPNVTGETDWVVGGCLLLRSDLCRQLGGFDERFFLFFEDTDLCKRVWKAGKRVVYFPEATGTDKKNRLSEGGIMALLTKKTARIHVWSGVKYFWKWGTKGEESGSWEPGKVQGKGESR